MRVCASGFIINTLRKKVEFIRGFYIFRLSTWTITIRIEPTRYLLPMRLV